MCCFCFVFFILRHVEILHCTTLSHAKLIGQSKAALMFFLFCFLMSEVHSLKSMRTLHVLRQSAQGFHLCCLSVLGWKTCSCPLEVDLVINFVFHWSVIRDKCSAKDFFLAKYGISQCPTAVYCWFSPCMWCKLTAWDLCCLDQWGESWRVDGSHPAHWYLTTLTSKLIDLHPIISSHKPSLCK